MHAISVAGGDIMQPSVQARGKARLMEAKARVMEARAVGARAGKEIAAKAKEIREREEKMGIVAKCTEDKAREVSRDRD